jgi:hypothetical protein
MPRRKEGAHGVTMGSPVLRNIRRVVHGERVGTIVSTP